jgi:glycosyltransferase involved in cell wall biosynthesis
MNVKEIKNLKVALVHDFLTTDGGAERVLRVLHDIWPESVVYSNVYFPEAFDPALDGWDIRTSFVNKLPFSRKLQHQYKLFHQLAMEQFRFDDYDLVISSTFAGYAKGVIVPVGVKHFSYVHNVPRFLWGLETALHGTLNLIYENIILPPLEHWWRIWDSQSAERPDRMFANSENVRRRISKFYRRDADVIYPPVDVESFLKLDEEKQDFFVYFGRIEKYKNIDMAIRACVANESKLKIIGAGSAREDLESLVDELDGNDYIEFLGRVSDEKLRQVVASAKAFIFPCPDEDFGIVPVESMAAGTPVIAFNSGGVKETVVDGVTGLLIDKFSQESLNRAIADFRTEAFNKDECRKRAKDFSYDNFKDTLLRYIASNF